MNRILIFTLLVLVILLTLIAVFGSKKEKKEQLLPIQVAPSYSPRPRQDRPQPPTSPSLLPTPSPSSTNTLQLIKVEPKEDLSLDHNPVTEIRFTFSEDIDLDNFLIDVSPDTQIRIIPDTSTHTYTISPKDFWPSGINTFTVNKGTKSLSGAILQDTFIYKINIQYPKNPPPDEDL